MNKQPTTANSTMATATLQAQAAQAQPQWARRKTGPVGRWSTLWPVYAELRGRGFTIREAVHWLIQEGAVKQEDRKKAEYGLPMVNSRRRKEGVVAATPKTAGMRKGRNRNKGTDGAKYVLAAPALPCPHPSAAPGPPLRQHSLLGHSTIPPFHHSTIPSHVLLHPAAPSLRAGSHHGSVAGGALHALRGHPAGPPPVADAVEGVSCVG